VCNIPPYARILIHAPSPRAVEAEPSANSRSTESDSQMFIHSLGQPSTDAKPPAGTRPIEGNAFQVFIKMIDGRTITIWVTSSSTVQDLKVAVKERDGLGEDEQRLLFGGKELRDPKTLLRDYNIQKENTIQLVGRLKGGLLRCKCVATPIQDKEYATVLCYISSQLVLIDG